MFYILFVNATICKHYKVKISKMHINRTNLKVINRAIHKLFHGRVNKLLTYFCLNDFVPSYKSIGYRTFQTKKLSLIGSGRLLFRTSTQVKAETPRRVRKNKFSIFYNAQFFCLKCTVSNLYNN